MRKIYNTIANKLTLAAGTLILAGALACGIAYTGAEAAIINSTDKDTSTDKEEDEQSFEKKAYLTEDDMKYLTWSFEKKEYAVITYDTITAKIITNIPSKFTRVNYSTDTYNTAINNSADGQSVQIRGSYDGTAKITATVEIDYCDENGIYAGVKTITATTQVKVIGTAVHSLTVGEQIKFDYTEYQEYAGMTYVFENAGYASVGEKGLITAIAPGYTAVYLTDGKDKNIYVGSLDIKGNDIYLSQTNVTRAIGSEPYKLELVNMKEGTVTWSSSNIAVATVDANGFVTPVAAGDTTITASYKAVSGLVMTYDAVFTVTSPMLSITSGNVAKGASLVINITGTTGQTTWSSSNKKVVSIYSGNYSTADTNASMANPSATIYGNKKGVTEITAQVDGIVLKCTITVTNPEIKKSFYVSTKGTRFKLNVTGINSNSVLKYSSSNKKVATVSNSGVVTTKGEGYALITIEVDSAVIPVSFNIGNKKAVKAVLNALKVEGATYSQARRMSKGYYDCSSLVWRSYSPLGAYFGDRHYAPVAANEAKYCVSHKKNVPAKYINKLNKLKPGDLIFFRGKSNGRYKNIYHVAMYMGQEGYGSYSIGKIIHADGRKVAQAYVYNQSNVVVIGRPFK